jgi:hypothetical protein
VSEEELPTEHGVYVEFFGVEIRQHPAESEFAHSSVGVPSSTLNSGVARFRPTNSTHQRVAARGRFTEIVEASSLLVISSLLTHLRLRTFSRDAEDWRYRCVSNSLAAA